MEAYPDWFLTSAYPVLEFVHYIFYITGFFLSLIGLSFYADFWQTKKDDLEVREQKISLISTLQRNAREPYHLLQLFEISIKEIVSNFSETSGAMFMVNRSQRRLVLTASAGLNKTEVASLEHYPMGQNLISQVVELGDPSISGKFDFEGSGNLEKDSRFRSTIILPMISGTEKIGVLMLFSERESNFSNNDVKFLMPLVEWLAEKINSAKLSRELNKLESNAVEIKESKENLVKTIRSICDSFEQSDNVQSFCRSLVGFAGADSIHLYGIDQGLMQIYGGSEPLSDLSENYKVALIEALDREKPIVINQEATTSDDKNFIARSSLVYPVRQNTTNLALLLLKEGSVITISDEDLKLLSIYSKYASLSLKQQLSSKLDINRKRGLEKIVELLRLDTISSEDDSFNFVKHFKTVVPENSIALQYEVFEDKIQFNHGLNNSLVEFDSFKILHDEGFFGELLSQAGCLFETGKNRISNLINQFDDENRNSFNRLFGENGIPGFLAVCPFFAAEKLVGGVIYFIYNLSETEVLEWRRLLTLSAGLCSIRLTIKELLNRKPEAPLNIEVGKNVDGEKLNQLNNHLTAIIGNAELAAKNSGDNSFYREIISEAEKAAEYLKKDSERINSASLEENRGKTGESLEDIIQQILRSNNISDGLYMAGGRPFEIRTSFKNRKMINIDFIQLKGLVQDTLDRFASQAEENEVITISTYERDSQLFLDFYRHQKNFPPAQPVVDIGRFDPVDQIAFDRPTDRFLDNLLDTGSYYSFDRENNRPTYLSFRFSGNTEQKKLPSQNKIDKHILAVDDQQVILDLISAMGQTSGYQISTAQNGQEALKLLENHKFDLVLTDLSMPGMSGLELSKKISDQNLNIPIILITGWGVNIDEQKLRYSGISQVLYKPFKIEELTSIINGYIYQ